MRQQLREEIEQYSRMVKRIHLFATLMVAGFIGLVVIAAVTKVWGLW